MIMVCARRPAHGSAAWDWSLAPFCTHPHPTFPRLVTVPGGKDRLVWRNYEPPFRSLLGNSRVIGDFHKSANQGMCVETDSTEAWWPGDPAAASRTTSPHGPECNASAAHHGTDFCDPALAGPDYGVPRFFCWPRQNHGSSLNRVPPWLLPDGALPKETVPGVWSSSLEDPPQLGRIQLPSVRNPDTPYNSAELPWRRDVTHPPSHYRPQELVKVVANYMGSCAWVRNQDLPVLCWEDGGRDLRRSDPITFAGIGYQDMFTPPAWLSTSRVLGLTAGSSFFCAQTDNATAQVACWGGNWRMPLGSPLREPTNTSRHSSRWATSPFVGHYLPPYFVSEMPDFTGVNVLSVNAHHSVVCATTDAATNPLKCWGDWPTGEPYGTQGQLRVPDGINVEGAITTDGFPVGERVCAITACTGNGALQPGEFEHASVCAR